MAKVSFDRDKKLDALRAEIRNQIGGREAEFNIPRAKTIKHSGMSPTSFYKCWSDPSLFRVWQLVRIYDYLRIPEAERRFS